MGGRCVPHLATEPSQLHPCRRHAMPRSAEERRLVETSFPRAALAAVGKGPLSYDIPILGGFAPDGRSARQQRASHRHAKCPLQLSTTVVDQQHSQTQPLAGTRASTAVRTPVWWNFVVVDDRRWATLDRHSPTPCAPGQPQFATRSGPLRKVMAVNLELFRHNGYIHDRPLSPKSAKLPGYCEVPNCARSLGDHGGGRLGKTLRLLRTPPEQQDCGLKGIGMLLSGPLSTERRLYPSLFVCAASRCPLGSR